MGVCTSSSVRSDQSRLIEKQLKEDEKRAAREVRLLLLGAGESGKSTILKQMKVIYASSFSDAERDTYRLEVFRNLVDAVKVVTDYVEYYHLTIQSSNRPYLALLENAPDLQDQDAYPDHFLVPLKKLWVDDAFQRCYARGNEFAANEQLSYWFGDVSHQGNGIDRLFKSDYRPTDQDILRVRRKTTGIVEETFFIEQWIYR